MVVKKTSVGSSIEEAGGEEEEYLLESGNEERPWRLNFGSIQRCSEYTDKPPKRHYCLRVLASEDGVAVYYQQQVEMLEGFNEMDALAVWFSSWDVKGRAR